MELMELMELMEAGGAGWFSGTSTASAWNDTTANSVISNIGLIKVLQDRVTLSKSTPTAWSTTKYWSGSSWIAAEMVINGNLVVTGTVLASSIKAGHIGTAVSSSANTGVSALATFGTAISSSATTITLLTYVNSSNTAVNVLITAIGRTGVVSGNPVATTTGFALFQNTVSIKDNGWTPATEDTKALCVVATVAAYSSATFKLLAAKSDDNCAVGANMTLSCIGLATGS